METDERVVGMPPEDLYSNGETPESAVLLRSYEEYLAWVTGMNWRRAFRTRAVA